MSAPTRWAGSWRVAGRIARRDAVRARGRTALVATMIGLPVLVGASAIALVGPRATGTAWTGPALVAGVAAVGLVESVLLIAPAFAIGARRSERHLALLSASGANGRDLGRVVLLTGTVIGASASLVGVGLGACVAAVIRSIERRAGGTTFPDGSPRWPLLLALVCVGTAIASISAAVPAWRAARLDVVRALTGQRGGARQPRVVPAIGVGLAAAGAVLILVGTRLDKPPVAVAGAVALLLGAALGSVVLLVLVGRIAPFLGFAGRFAVRDAARQRLRSAPAVVAILAALAAVTASVAYQHAGDEEARAGYGQVGAIGTVAVGLDATSPGAVNTHDFNVQAVADVLRQHLALQTVTAVSIAMPPAGSWPDVSGPDTPETQLPTVDADLPGGTQCSGYDATDPFCGPNRTGSLIWQASRTGPFVVVDDGTVVRLLDAPGSADAADALAAGKVVVASLRYLQPNGTAHLAFRPGGVGGVPMTADLPAVVADLGSSLQFSLVLPPSTLPALGLRQAVVGLIATTSEIPSMGAEAAARQALAGDVPSARLVVERGYRSSLSGVSWMLVFGALLAGLAIAGLAVALAAADSLPDLATLAAIGAAPRTRRAVAAAQAGALAFVGTVAGVLVGLMLAYVLVFAHWGSGGPARDASWLPWPTLVVLAAGAPLLAIGGTWLMTQSRLPMVRRPSL